MKKHYLLCLFLLALNFKVGAAERPEDRWNLADLYPGVAEWNVDAAKLDKQIEEFGACQGHLGDSVQRFKACFDLNADLTKRYYRLAVYAGELLSQDTGAASSLELGQKAQTIGTRVDEAAAFVNPEILGLGNDRVQALLAPVVGSGVLAQDASLRIYRFPLEQILRAAPHTLDTKGEGIVASFGLTSGAAGAVYKILSNADLPWPKVKLHDGKEVKIDQSAYTQYREATNRGDRKKVFDAFWGKWKEFERTFGVTFYENLKKDSVYAKVRKYPDSRTLALDRDKVPVAVYDTLIAQVNANLPTLHRYFKLRARMLGVKEMHYYDIYPPLVGGDFKFPIDQGKQLMLKSVAPLGAAYVADMEKGLQGRWMDVYPRPRKQSGAHMAGDAYDVHPYLLLNYTGNYGSVSTLTHEWGHALHSVLATQSQPFVTSSYSIFIAEIASTLNEALLLEHMLKVAKTDDERQLYLGSALENLRGTFFRQAMFAEFERDVHAMADRGESLTGDKLTKIYGEILRRYHGDKQGVVKIDDPYTVEWAFIPHFYNSFYVYQYATSIAASSLFADAILKGEAGAQERYLNLLRAGGSDYPYAMVKAAGVDLATPAPYQAIVARMNRIMDEIEAIQARRGK